MNIKTCFGISSCKGGVGKINYILQYCNYTSKPGYKVGLLDADIYGPSCAYSSWDWRQRT